MQNRLDEPFDPNQPLSETIFAIFDVETTGLSPAYGDRVCEVACLRLRDGVEIARFESMVDPERPISAGASRVNQITPEMLVGAPRFEAVATAVLEMMADAVLVAHNAPFDLGFLAAELEIARMPPPEGPVVDTLALARRAYSFARNSLPAVAATLAVDTGPAHRAMGDVSTTRHVLERILWDLDRRWSVTTLGQLLAFQGGSIPYPLPRALPLPPAIAEALEGRGRVQMRYVDARGQETTRAVRPLRVHELRGNLYMIAHCFRAGELRTFRLDRVVEMSLEDRPGEPPDGLVHLQLTDLAGAIRQAEGPLPAGIRLRAADPATDLPLIAELYNAAFGPGDPAKATPDEVARLAQHPGLDPSGVFLAFDGDLAVGLGVVSVERPAAWQTSHRGAIELLAVRPAYRRQGIGRALVRAVLAWLADQGVVTVGVSAEDPAVIALLQRYGFREALPSLQPRPPAGQPGPR